MEMELLPPPPPPPPPAMDEKHKMKMAMVKMEVMSEWKDGNIMVPIKDYGLWLYDLHFAFELCMCVVTYESSLNYFMHLNFM